MATEYNENDDIEIDLSEADWDADPDAWEEDINDPEPVAQLPDAKSSWSEVDAWAYLRGQVDEQPPTVLARNDGHCLLYRGKVSSIAGEPESGKGWFAMLACLQAMAAGQHVVYVDFEDGPRLAYARLRALKVPDHIIAGQFHYVHPTEPLLSAKAGGKTASHFVEVLWRVHADLQGDLSLIVFDGITEALSNQGLQPNANDEVSQWFTNVPRYYARHTKAAVLLVDHVVKSTDNRGRYAVGAGAKLAAIDGSQFTVELRKAFARNRSGVVRINVTKDRPGFVREVAVGSGHTQAVADMIVTADDEDGKLALTLVPPDIKVSEDGKVTPTGIEGQIVKYMRRVKGSRSRAHILSQITGRTQTKHTAFNNMLDQGWLVEVKNERKTEYKLGTPKDEIEVQQ